MRLFLHIFSVVVAVLLGMVWFMSPLALGFSKWPVDDGPFSVINIYVLSYSIGLPLLAVAQVSSVVLIFTRWQRRALPLSLLSLLSLCLFLLPPIYVLSAVGVR